MLELRTCPACHLTFTEDRFDGWLCAHCERAAAAADRRAGYRRVCGAWGPSDDPALPADWPMAPACNLTAGHDGPHRGSFGITWWTTGPDTSR